MKIYTKTGDEGTTGLFGGTRVLKDHLRVEAYGSIDELNSHLGRVRGAAQLDERLSSMVSPLFTIQNQLFDIGSELARDPSKASKVSVPEIAAESVAALEAHIDSGDAELKPLKTFILPGGHPVSSDLHIARTVCRRAERRLVTLVQQDPHPPRPLLVRYVNRLSDLLFTWARLANHRTGTEDIAWKAV